MTMSPVYRKRLQNEYEKAMDLNRKANGLIILKPASGQTVPYVEKYLATFNFPTWVKAGSQIKKQNSTTVIIEIRGISNPMNAMIPDGDPIPYHPNWYAGGKICNGDPGRPELRELIQYIEFVFAVLQFQDHRINPKSPANLEANEYWMTHKNDRSMFPTDNHPFPTGEPVQQKSTLRIVSVTRNRKA